MNNDQIKQAVAQFEALLNQQLQRAENLKEQSQFVDYNCVKPLMIGYCQGDGIGSVITPVVIQALKQLLADKIACGDIKLVEITGLTIENRLAKNETVPAQVLEQIKQCHVFLKGPLTTPQAGVAKQDLESANVTLRRELDLFANVRPVCIPEYGIDWTFYRENTEGEYVLGSSGIEIPDTLCMDFKVTTDLGTKRIAKAAFDFAKNNGKNHVAIVTKANIMKKTDGKFSRICHEVAKDYPGIECGDWFVDIMSANLINMDVSKNYQVFVMPNLYGDILTDEAAQIQGGVGTAGSANIGSRYAMFEAIHGSAPRMFEDGSAPYANPCSLLKAAELMLRHIGLATQATKLSNAVDKANQLVNMTGGPDGVTCQAFGQVLIENL